MSKTKNTKSALLMSFTSLLLCFAMLIGSTFAWFTDTATASVNKIQAGTLDVALLDTAGNSLEGKTLKWVRAIAEADEAELVGSEDILWEPGCTYNLQPIVIKNNGNLALKYKIVISGIVGDAQLLEAIDFTVTGVEGATTAAALNGFEGKLAANATTDAITISGHMKESAGNDYQGKFIDNIAITVVATQDTAEFDSTTDQYDADATYPVAVAANVVVGDNNKVTEQVIVQSAEKVGSTDTPVAKVTVPAEAAVLDGNNQLTLTVDEVATPANIEVAAGTDTKTFEVDMKGLDKTSNTALFKVELYVGQNHQNLVMKHNGADMTKKDSLNEVLADQDYYYDSATGVVTFLTSTFSPFTAVYDKDSWSNHAAESYVTSVDTSAKVVTIASAEELALFAKEVNSGKNYARYTVKLTADIDLMGDSFAWTPINGFTGTFDGENHTISNLWVYGGEEGKGFGLFGSSNAQAVKNLKIHNAYVYGNSAVAAVLGSSNAVVTNVHVDGLLQIGTTTHNGHIANFNSSYIGGIVGYGYPKVSNCSVKGTEGSLIGGGRQVGGIIGFSGEGKSDRASNCTVENVKLTGTRCVGGIIGWAHYGNNVKNCTVNKVDLEVTGTETNTIGTITGTSYTNTGNNYDEFVGNTATNCTLTVDGKTPVLSAPYDMYATYAAGSCYIKRGDNTYIYCEDEAQANTIKQDGDVIISMAN